MTDSPLARYLVPLRRWWPVLAGVLALAMVVAWVTLPGAEADADGEASEPQMAYRATHLLIRARDTAVTANIDLVTLVARQGAIPAAVEAELGDRVEPGWLEALSIVADPTLGTLAITVSQPTADQTVLLATAYADAIVEYFDAEAIEAEELQIDRLTQQVASIDQRVRQLEEELQGLEEGSVEAGFIEAEINTNIERFALLQSELRDLSLESGAALPTFTSLQDPVAVAAGESEEARIGLPGAVWARFLLAAFVALIGGVGLILAIDWLDTRIRTREDAEEAFGLPVVAELPRRSRADLRDNPIPVLSHPGSITAEVFRALRLSVLRSPRWRLDRSRPGVEGDGHVATAVQVTGAKDPRVLLITSARDGEGKSTVAANLAVSIAETGKSVLLIDSDFRRPAVGALVGVPPGPGLQELQELNGQELAKAIVFTEVPNLAMLRSGGAGIAPPWFMTEADWVVEQARDLADIVVIDTGPLLATNEAATLVPNVDALLLATKSGRISRSQAHRATEQLARLGATVSGVVVVGVDGTRRYGYYEPVRNAARTGERLFP